MSQKGFTLLELLVTLAIMALLGAGAVMSLHQVSWGTLRSRSQVIALTNIDQAILAIKKDLTMTQTTSFADNATPQSSVTLSWIDYTGFSSQNSTSHSVSYTLNGTALWRTYDSIPNIVARNIAYIGFTKDGRLVSVNITATGPGIQQRSETIKFSIYTRTESQ